MRLKVYVGCGLTNAPQSFRDLVASFKAKLAKERNAELEFEILEFIGLQNGTAEQVYDHDLGNVRNCSAMIAFVDHPSIGLGMELAEAIRCEKTILCLHRPEAAVTRMVMGARDKQLLAIRPYENVDGAVTEAWGFITFQQTVWRRYG